MFCSECGANNEDGAKFCEACGTKLEADIETSVINQEVKQVKQAIKKPMSMIQKVTIGGVLFVVISIGIFYKVGQYISDPKKEVEKYITSIEQKNWKEAFTYLDTVESAFLNADTLPLATEYQLNAEKINNFKVIENRADLLNTHTDEIGLTKGITVYYTTKGNPEQKEMTLELTKQKEKTLFFFDSWKISANTLMVEDYSICVPQGTTVTLDGIKIAEQYLTGTEEGFDTYVLDSVFEGKHVITITSSYMEDVEAEVYMSDEDVNNYSLYDIVLKLEVKDTLIQQASDDLSAIYDAALQGQDFSTVKELFAPDEETQSYMEGNYNNLVDSMKSDENTGLIELSFHNCTGELNGETNYGISPVSLYLEYGYDYSANRKDWWTDSMETYSDSGSGSSNFTFTQSDDKWLISSMDFNKIYY